MRMFESFGAAVGLTVGPPYNRRCAQRAQEGLPTAMDRDAAR
jgi:hypothetical protein